MKILATMLILILTGCGQASEYPDDGYYYITLPGGAWVVEQLPQEYPSNQITVSKEDGTIHTIFSINGGDVAWLCTQETRDCKELRRPPMMVPDFMR